jgi:hypothetical protein
MLIQSLAAEHADPQVEPSAQEGEIELFGEAYNKMGMDFPGGSIQYHLMCTRSKKP